uniref:Uncharacterized protein n=1 Tax=Clastoptera arizonana TaxID=38151 RepID=A0A1B6C4A7_9HEMI
MECNIMSRNNYKVPIRGGLFNVQKVQYSKETHTLLSRLIEESKLSIKQRKALLDNIKKGDGLICSDTTTNGRKFLKKKETLVPPSSSKKRSLDLILKSGAYERETFSSQHNREDRTKEICRLQNLMAYGTDIMSHGDFNYKQKIDLKEKYKDFTSEDEIFQYLLEDVKDRVDFLKEMEALGEEKTYRLIIEQEVASKMRQMLKINPVKFKELEDSSDIKSCTNKI